MQLVGILSLLPGPILLAALISVLIWGLAQFSLMFVIRIGLPLIVLAVGLGFAVIDVLPRSVGLSMDERDVARLKAIVGPLCMTAGLREPKIVFHSAPYANSWTDGFGSPPTLHVTSRLFEILDDHQLSAVIAHELSHVAQKDSALMSAVNAPVVLMLGFGRFFDMYAATGWRRVWPILLIPIGVLLISLGSICRAVASGFSRARELEADAGAARLTGNPAALAAALIAIGGSSDGIASVDLRRAESLNLLHIVAVGGEHRVFRTHPPLKRRLEQLSHIEARLQRKGLGENGG
ncbi:MAG TPA: M48 family metalloprotease [Solirubrobacteraceae bacterium]